MCSPVLSPPVKAILATLGCVTSGSPTSGPKPVTMLTTPGGNPAFSNNSPKANAETDEYSDGFQTTVLPAASAGASFHVASSSGEFQGSNRGDDAERLFAREVEDSGLVDRNHAAFDLVGQAAEIVEPLRDVIELAAHLGDELAVVACFRFRQSRRASAAMRSPSLRSNAPRAVAVSLRHSPR